VESTASPGFPSGTGRDPGPINRRTRSHFASTLPPVGMSVSVMNYLANSPEAWRRHT
jgi:hypothetical protein